MKKSSSIIWIAIALLLTFSLPSCSDDDNQIYTEEETQPKTGIVNRTDCGTFWRYDFNYETVDTDGKTPITLSAAIFMTRNIHEKRVKAKGCGLVNHYTITADWQRPTNVTGGLTLEGVLSNTNYILIESDGYGFGMDAQGNQHYLPLILSGMIDAGGNKVKNEDIFSADFLPYLSELLDTKEHDTDYINGFIYDRYGTPNDRRVTIDKIVAQAFFDEQSEPMKEITYHLKKNSLVYEPWTPSKTGHITFVHSRADEVVPYLNQESMKDFLIANGYTAFDIDDSSKLMHTDTGTLYALKALACIGAFVPAGQ